MSTCVTFAGSVRNFSLWATRIVHRDNESAVLWSQLIKINDSWVWEIEDANIWIIFRVQMKFIQDHIIRKGVYSFRSLWTKQGQSVHYGGCVLLRKIDRFTFLSLSLHDCKIIRIQWRKYCDIELEQSMIELFVNYFLIWFRCAILSSIALKQTSDVICILFGMYNGRNVKFNAIEPFLMKMLN